MPACRSSCLRLAGGSGLVAVAVDASRPPGRGFSAATIAAPMIPASLRSSAGTTSHLTVSRGMYLSALLLTPPPRIMRFGHISCWIRSRCSSRSAAHAFHDSPRSTRAAAAERSLGGTTADLHLTELGVGDEHAVVEHARSDAGPERQEDDHALPVLADAEAHLGDPRGIGVVDDDDRALEHLGQPFDDREVDPGLVDVAGELEHAVDGHAGQPDADRRRRRRGRSDLTSRLTSRAIEAMTASGVDGTGVGTRSRSEIRRPVSTSTTAALIPLPPTSMPMASRPGRRPSRTPRRSSMVLPIRRSEVVDGDPAVDDERRAVRPARLVRGEIDGHVDDLLGLAEPPGRVACQAELLGRLVLDQPVHQQRRLHRARADRVGPDPLRPELDRQAPRQRQDRALRRSVGVLRHAAADQRDEARDVDDRPAARLDHRRDRELAAEEDAADVDGHHRIPGRDVGVDDRVVGLGHDAGVVVQAVEPAVGRDGMVDHRLRVGFAGDVGLDEGGLAAGGAHHVDGLCAGRLASTRRRRPWLLRRRTSGRPRGPCPLRRR